MKRFMIVVLAIGVAGVLSYLKRPEGLAFLTLIGNSPAAHPPPQSQNSGPTTVNMEAKE